MKYEGSKVPVEETSVRVYGVAYVILVSAQLKSPLNFALCSIINKVVESELSNFIQLLFK